VRELPDACATCAFDTKSETAGEPYNVLKGHICVLAGIPFYCHHRRSDGHDFHKDRVFTSRAFVQREMTICRGWQREVRALEEVRTPDSRTRVGRMIVRSVGKDAIEYLEIVGDPKRGHKRAIKRLGQILKTLADYIGIPFRVVADGVLRDDRLR
jgi:hypothetical protein